MNRLLVLGSSFLVLGLCTTAHTDEPFRPEPGTFAPIEKAHQYRGELVFVDHVNRRGSVRVAGNGQYSKNDPHPIAMLPYGMVRYHGAPADLRDIPLGTMLHVYGFLPPDPKISSVPVLPVDNKEKDAKGRRGTGIFPAENHVLILEDEPSHCLRNGLVWKLKELEINHQQGLIVASREPESGASEKTVEESMTFDAATRIWRGKERLSIADMIDEGIWPANGKHVFEDQSVLLGVAWKPTPSEIFTRFHITDIWLDDKAMQRAASNQTETHKAFIRSRWMPARVDAVEYGKFGHATVTTTLFGGMDLSLYEDFKKGELAMMNASGPTLKHNHGKVRPSHMASKGPIVEVIQSEGEIPLGSSGIQIRMETDLIIEGIRPGRIVRLSLNCWPQVHLPREEYLRDGAGDLEFRFPTPDIFPKY